MIPEKAGRTGPRGFEPLTLRLRAACSTELSYGPTTGTADPNPEHKASVPKAVRGYASRSSAAPTMRGKSTVTSPSTVT